MNDNFKPQKVSSDKLENKLSQLDLSEDLGNHLKEEFKEEESIMYQQRIEIEDLCS